MTCLTMPPTLSNPRRGSTGHEGKFAKTKSDSAITDRSSNTLVTVDLTALLGSKSRPIHIKDTITTPIGTPPLASYRKSSLIDFSNDLGVTFGPTTPRFFTATSNQQKVLTPKNVRAYISFDDDVELALAAKNNNVYNRQNTSPTIEISKEGERKVEYSENIETTTDLATEESVKFSSHPMDEVNLLGPSLVDLESETISYLINKTNTLVSKGEESNSNQNDLLSCTEPFTPNPPSTQQNSNVKTSGFEEDASQFADVDDPNSVLCPSPLHTYEVRDPVQAVSISDHSDVFDNGTIESAKSFSRLPVHENPKHDENTVRLLKTLEKSCDLISEPSEDLVSSRSKFRESKRANNTRNTLFGSTVTVNETLLEEASSSNRRMANVFSFFKPRWLNGSSMKCSCMSSAGSYERLPHVNTFLELSSIYNRDSEDKDLSTEKQEELLFYNDDSSYQSVVVEKDLCVSDLCQLLALKNRVSKDVNWTIVEHWMDLGLERSLEDHEDVLSTYQSMEAFSKKSRKKLVFRKDFSKYEFFHSPQQYFPSSMINWGEPDGVPIAADNTSALQAIVKSGNDCPVVFSHVWVQDTNKQMWSKAFLLLKDRKLYLSSKVHAIRKLIRSDRSSSSSESSPTNSPSSSPYNKANNEEEAEIYAELCHYSIYTTLNAKNQFRAPTEFGICLRPLWPSSDSNDTPQTVLKCLSCDSDRVRVCWITAMRLAKYGKQLRENYRSFRNKHLENMSPKQYNNFILPNESVRSRVAMDFTGSVGRIVEDPKEAKAIALAEGYTWKRRWRPAARQSSGKSVSTQGSQSSIHLAQPWFHASMSRDMAAALVAKHGTVNGVFLVRDCQSNPGAYVLTLKTGNKVVHKEINLISEPDQETMFYTLDGGNTKFYDLLQLVEFYQINAGCLPSRLTHYLVQDAGGVHYREKTNRTVPSC